METKCIYWHWNRRWCKQIRYKANESLVLKSTVTFTLELLQINRSTLFSESPVLEIPNISSPGASTFATGRFNIRPHDYSNTIFYPGSHDWFATSDNDAATASQRPYFKGDLYSRVSNRTPILINRYGLHDYATNPVGDDSATIRSLVDNQSVYFGWVDGDLVGNLYTEGGYKFIDNGTTTDGDDGTRAKFFGDHLGDVYTFTADGTGTIKVLESGTGGSEGGSWLDVEEVYADIYAEDRAKTNSKHRRQQRC